MVTTAKDFLSYTVTRRVVAANVLGVTNAGTTAVDMDTCRQGMLIVDLTIVTDVPTDLILEHSADNTTFSTLETVDDADIAASGINTYNLENMLRYVRATWTRTLANADSYWALIVVGDLAVRTPIT